MSDQDAQLTTNNNSQQISANEMSEQETTPTSSDLLQLSDEEMLQLIEGEWNGVSRESHEVRIMTWLDDSPSHIEGEQEADDGLCFIDDYSGTLSISGNEIVNYGEEYYAEDGREQSVSGTIHEITSMEEVPLDSIVNDLRFYGRDEVRDTYTEKAYSFNLAFIETDSLPFVHEDLKKNRIYYFVDDENIEHLIWYRESQGGEPYERAERGHPTRTIKYHIVKYHWTR